MSGELRELYQSVVIDHGRHPRNFGVLSHPTHQREGFNPLCGDKILVHIVRQNNKIEEIAFTGVGCAISMASASLMSEVVKGKTIAELKILFSDFHALVTLGTTSEHLGKLAILGGVREFPARVKCATLAWHTLMAALDGDKKEIVSTEEGA